MTSLCSIIYYIRYFEPLNQRFLRPIVNEACNKQLYLFSVLLQAIPSAVCFALVILFDDILQACVELSDH